MTLLRYIPEISEVLLLLFVWFIIVGLSVCFKAAYAADFREADCYVAELGTEPVPPVPFIGSIPEWPELFEIPSGVL